MFGNSLFGGDKLTANTDLDKYKYCGYDFWFDARGSFPLSNGSRFRKNVIVFGAEVSSSLLIDNKKKYNLILCKGSTTGLDVTSLTAGKEYAINFTEQLKKFCLNLPYNGVNRSAISQLIMTVLMLVIFWIFQNF